MDFTQYQQSEELPSDKLELITYHTNMLKERQVELANLEEEVKAKKQEILQIERQDIPQAMNDAGMAKFTLKTGEEVTVTDELKASIKTGTESLAYQSMINTEAADPNCPRELAEKMVENLWKEVITIENLPKGEQQELINKGISFQPKLSINWRTLNKWAKQIKERGLTIPPEISIFEFQQAKIK